MPSNKGNLWPTCEQELLLRACLLEHEEVLNAYKKWASTVNVEALDHGSSRLLPLLYRNLQTLGIESPLLDKFKGTYRHAYYKNKLRLNRMIAILKSLEQASIEVLVLKGAALIAAYYGEFGLRPMVDFDLLVRPEKALVAIHALEQSGWKARPGPPFTQGFPCAFPSWPFRHADGTEVDLHWYALDQCCYPEADTGFWQSVIVAQIDGFPIKVLAPTDQLLHLCVHGAEWNQVPPLRWIADAMTVLKSTEAKIDWQHFLREARERRLTLATAATLGYLRERFHAPVPASLVQELHATRVSVTDRLQYWSRTSPPGSTLKVREIFFGYLQYRRTLPRTMVSQLISLPKYLQFRWGASHPWAVPRLGLRLVANRIRNRPQTRIA